jgi:spore maturation protein SpmB
MQDREGILVLYMAILPTMLFLLIMSTFLTTGMMVLLVEIISNIFSQLGVFQ